jgi:hypothetical protein
MSIRCKETKDLKPSSNENASQRKFEHTQISSQVEATCYKLARACNSFEWYKRKLMHVTTSKLAFSFEQGLKVHSAYQSSDCFAGLLQSHINEWSQNKT